jgi:DNA-binding transcriptional MerR regulator
MSSVTFHIGEAAQQLGVTPKHLRTLERRGRIPPAHRDYNGRIYSQFDIALLRAMGVGSDRHVFSLSKRFWRGRDER